MKDSEKKNVIVFNTDQQRADSLGCMGNPLAVTPALDRLAARGTLYRHHYASNPVCMPSRASFITGRHLSAHRVLDNGIFLSEEELTMPEVFRRHGYRTVSVGKLHFQPTSDTFDPRLNTSMENVKRWECGELDGWSGPYYGFEDVELAIGHGEAASGHYGRWREKRFPGLALGPEHARGVVNFPEVRSYKSNLPLEAHSSTWVADRAVAALDRLAGQPFYLNVSFPDPHVPFTPPAPYSTMFDDVEFPGPYLEEGENERKPQPYRVAMQSGANDRPLSPSHVPGYRGKAWQQTVAHTYGMVSLIDTSVGRVLEKLGETSLTDNTIVVFTSDHGDFLGDHHFFCKSVVPCRSLLHVPLIIAEPGERHGCVDHVCSNVDVMPTLLERCGIEVPVTVQGKSLPRPGESFGRDHAFESGWSKFGPQLQHYTIYKQDWRISVFPHVSDGELYDLREDPHELNNRYHDPKCRSVKSALTEELLFAVGAAEPQTPPNAANW